MDVCSAKRGWYFPNPMRRILWKGTFSDEGQVEVVAKEGMTCDADFGVYFEHEELRE